MRNLVLAIGFLTVIPVRVSDARLGDLGRAAGWFTAVGLALAALLAAALTGLVQFFPPLLTSALIVTIWVGLTGGLHLDGLADACDGLLASVPRERRLEIMRDPHRGAFGSMCLALMLILKVAALAAALETGSAAYALLLALPLARWAMLIVARGPAARPEGMGADLANGLHPRSIALAALVPLALMPVGGLRSVAAFLLSVLLALGVAQLARRRLGGTTGDVLGVVVEVVEVGVLLVFGAWANA